jgi:cytochrome c-type biogenesis protein CcmH
MKYKIILVGLFLFIALFQNNMVIAQNPNEEAVQKSASEIYNNIMCPICAGQTIAQSSNETSRQMRELVLKMLRQGETKEEILEYFASRYGERILAKPNKKGFNLMLWIFPFVLVIFVGIGIYLMLRRWSAETPAEKAPQIDKARLAGYEERLEKELQEFDKGL